MYTREVNQKKIGYVRQHKQKDQSIQIKMSFSEKKEDDFIYVSRTHKHFIETMLTVHFMVSLIKYAWNVVFLHVRRLTTEICTYYCCQLTIIFKCI